MKIIDDIPFSFDRAEFDRLVRFDPEAGLGEEVDDLLGRLLPRIRPKAVYAESPVLSIEGDRVAIGSARFRSAMLARNLAKTSSVTAYVATCGTEADEACPPGDDPLIDFWADAVKEMALRAAVARLIALASAEGSAGHMASMNPGSGNVDLWPLSEQRALFTLIGDVEGAVGVRLLPSLLMSPDKTVSGILFQSEEGWVSCSVCSRADCPNRRAPQATPV